MMVVVVTLFGYVLDSKLTVLFMLFPTAAEIFDI